MLWVEMQELESLPSRIYERKGDLALCGTGSGSEGPHAACRFGGEALDLNYEVICVHICCISITLSQQRVFIST